MSAVVLERLTIGRGVTIAAGAVVRRDIPDHALVAGSRAVIKKIDHGLR
jgi:acetyltransferase-like isoleucine patch superfamily enzyme